MVRHLPLIFHAIDCLGIRDVVNECCPRDPRNRVSNGDCVAVMIANIIHGRVALYEMDNWLGQTDVDLLLGKDTPAEAFHDDRLGSCLDLLFHAGTEFVFSEVARGVLARPEVESSFSAHADTTSVRLFGRYEEDPKRPWPEGTPEPKKGYSKDHRPDLKQLVFGLATHGPTRIPIGFSVLDGNTSDTKANRFQIETLAQLLPASDDVTIVADCKFVDAVTLGSALHSGFHYVSLLPRSFNLRRELVEEVRAAGSPLPPLCAYPGRTQSAPERVYQATSVVRPFLIHNPEGDFDEVIQHRFLVIRSSTKEAEFDGKIDRRVSKAEAKLSKKLSQLAKREFACQKDLEKEVNRTTKGTVFHRVTTQIGTVEVARKRKRRGRPRKGEEPPMETVWKLTSHSLTRDEAQIAVERFHAAGHGRRPGRLMYGTEGREHRG